jgi:hypothetical protein
MMLPNCSQAVLFQHSIREVQKSTYSDHINATLVNWLRHWHISLNCSQSLHQNLESSIFAFTPFRCTKILVDAGFEDEVYEFCRPAKGGGRVEVKASMYFTAFPTAVFWCMIHPKGVPFWLGLCSRQTQFSHTWSDFSIIQVD